MKNSKKRGFTIVELVIVIAVIAILAGVLIPTFVSVIKKGQEANDTALIKYLNTSLTAGTIGGKAPETMQGALDIVEADGYNVAKIKATASGARILWDSKNNCFVYLKDGENEPTYIPDSKTQNVANVDYWQITEADEDLSGKYSNYLALGYTKDLSNVQTGLDVGQNDNIAAITYKGTTAAQNVVIRTNSFDTVITVNAENDVVHHHGDVKEVNVAKVAPSSYHEYGTVSGNINLAYGKVELMNGSSVSNVVVKTIEGVTPTTENVKVSVESGAKATLVISEVANVSVAVEGTGAETVAKIDDIAGKVAAIGSKTYSDIKTALTDAKENEVVTLLADVAMAAQCNINKTIVIDLNGMQLSSTYFSDWAVNLSKSKYLTVKNGAISITGYGGFYVPTNAGLTLSNVDYRGGTFAVYPGGDASYVNIFNSSISKVTVGIATNAGGKQSNNVKVTIESSTFDCIENAIWSNVPSTYHILNSVIMGGWQAVMVRGGTATIVDSELILKSGNSSLKVNDDKYLLSAWASGDNVPRGALIVGNYSNGYPRGASCTLTNTKVSTDVSGWSRSLIVLAQVSGYETILNYDTDCGISSSDYLLCNPTVEGIKKGQITVNGTVVQQVEK